MVEGVKVEGYLKLRIRMSVRVQVLWFWWVIGCDFVEMQRFTN